MGAPEQRVRRGKFQTVDEAKGVPRSKTEERRRGWSVVQMVRPC